MTNTSMQDRPPRPPDRSRFEADLIRQILSSIYPEGSKLPSERELAETSGLSRPVVREVLQGLVGRGLIEIRPARGAFVRTPGSLQIAEVLGSLARQHRATPRDLVEAREMVEARSAAGAAERASDHDIARLRELVAAFDDATTTIERARCDLVLHASIARMSGNPVLEVMFGAITPMVLDLQLRSLSDPVVVRLGAPIHHEVVDAIARRDAATAAEAMARHIVLALDLYGDDLDVPLDVLAENQLSGLLPENGRIEDMIEDVLRSRRPVAGRVS